MEEEKWIELPNLANERANAKAIPIGDKIFIIGGCDTLQNISQIDMYSYYYIRFDIETGTFWLSQQSLSMSAEVKSVHRDSD